MPETKQKLNKEKIYQVVYLTATVICSRFSKTFVTSTS